MGRSDHLTDREILLLVDGELTARRQREVRGHVDACWSCRARVTELEGTIAAFAHEYRESLDAQLPPVAGPRALLRAQLENALAGKKRWRGGQWFWVAASVMAACLAMFAVYERGVFTRAGELSVPRNTLTPGEARNVTLEEVCRGTAEETVNVPVSVRQQVFREYGIRDGRANAYEVDYLITPDLGGTSSLRNLWPQPYSAVWNAHVKDELEDRLHGLVCTGQVDLSTAQREISQDWIAAYKKYFHTDRPLRGRTAPADAQATGPPHKS